MTTEELCKLMGQINELKCRCGSQMVYNFDNCLTLESKFVVLMRAVQEVLASYSDVLEGFEDLQNFVNNYFANLDVQEEINNKINEMVESGEFSDIIRQLYDYRSDNVSPLNMLIMSQDKGTTTYHWTNNLFQSLDGVNFFPILELPHLEGANAVLYYKNGWVWKLSYANSISELNSTVRLQRSKNLYDWDEVQIIIPGVTSTATFSNPGSIFEYNGMTYLCFNTNDTTKTEVNSNGIGYSIYVATIQFNSDGTVNVGTAKDISPDGEPNIDPYIWVEDGAMYMMYRTDKTQDTTVDGIYFQQLNPSTMLPNSTAKIKMTCFCDADGVNACEAPSIAINDKWQTNGGYKYYVYADDWSGRLIPYPGAGMVVARGNTIAEVVAATAEPINNSVLNMRAGAVVQLCNFPEMLGIVNQYKKLDITKGLIYSNQTSMIKNHTLYLAPNSNNLYLINNNFISENSIRKISGLKRGAKAYLILPSMNSLQFNSYEDSNIQLPQNQNIMYYGSDKTETIIEIMRAPTFDDVYYINTYGTKNITKIITQSTKSVNITVAHSPQPQAYMFVVNENYNGTDRVGVFFYTYFNNNLYLIKSLTPNDSTLYGNFHADITSTTSYYDVISLYDNVLYTSIICVSLGDATLR